MIGAAALAVNVSYGLEILRKEEELRSREMAH